MLAMTLTLTKISMHACRRHVKSRRTNLSPWLPVLFLARVFIIWGQWQW